MKPIDVGKSYDSIADRWQNPESPLDGRLQHERAFQFVTNRSYALDAGCGCNGRFIDLLRRKGFTVEGVDVSECMTTLARERDSTVRFYHADICEWELPRKYDFITGWDSIWHVSLASQSSATDRISTSSSTFG
jgi:2-polyprenyl-3-methyl-5-hydroxy-6-metoxy-1,4-benzoquinol methylase